MLTGCLTLVLIPQLKIALVFYSMYVTGMGGAKASQANADNLSIAVETHCFISHTLLIITTKKEPFVLTLAHSKTVAWTLGQGP